MEVRNRDLTIYVIKVKGPNGDLTIYIVKVKVRNGDLTIYVVKFQVRNGDLTIYVVKVKVRNENLPKGVSPWREAPWLFLYVNYRTCFPDVSFYVVFGRNEHVLRQKFDL